MKGWKGIALVGLAGLIMMACGPSRTTGPRPLPTPPPPQVQEPEVPENAPDDLTEAGDTAFHWFWERIDFHDGTRMGLGWPSSDPYLFVAAKSLARSIPGMILLPDVGVSTAGYQESLVQLDPSTFDGMFWIEPISEEEELLLGINVVFHPTRNAQSLPLRMVFPEPLPVHGPSGPEAKPRKILAIKGDVHALAFDSKDEEIWWVGDSRVVRYSLPAGREMQSWPRSGDAGKEGPIPPVLRSLKGPDGSLRLAFFDPRGGAGVRYHQSGSSWLGSVALTGFPLTEREARFLSAPYDLEYGDFQLLDFQTDEMARFRNLQRIESPIGSLLVLEDRFGTLLTFSGNTMEPLASPTDSRITHTTVWGDLLIAGDHMEPFHVHAYRLRMDGAWEKVWSSRPLPSRVLAMAAGKHRNTPTLFLAIREGGGVSVYTLRLPE